MTRQCGDCQLCCRLLPVPPLGKKAGQKCEYQKFGKGCTVYRTHRMPPECGLWSCRWLVQPDETADLSRPDRAGFVIDIMPDYITLQDNETKATMTVQVVQIWIDPKHPDAHRDPALRAYLHRRGEEGIAALVRYDNRRAMTLLPPNMIGEGTPPAEWHQADGWIEVPYDASNVTVEHEHSIVERVQALGGEAKVVMTP